MNYRWAVTELPSESDTVRSSTTYTLDDWIGPVGPGVFHPEPLTEPDVNLSIHTARVTARRLLPSINCRVPPLPVDPALDGVSPCLGAIGVTWGKRLVVGIPS